MPSESVLCFESSFVVVRMIIGLRRLYFFRLCEGNIEKKARQRAAALWKPMGLESCRSLPARAYPPACGRKKPRRVFHDPALLRCKWNRQSSP